ncbi:MAG: ABC transporter ATP-binding protein [Rhodospirillum sp.]|nr:ABC transporter ATP-binding protein [Rhodospirillum sp.]MCF8490073.1 ABC transporter ATP-binding protein [Rhodospirillum sp.]MCF8500432.1 ABC transporter ATP-binding protein [Rhodospirillum sp.]
MTVLLDVNSVDKSYGSLHVTQHLSFSLAEGEALGVIGPNGAGKTTLFNLITGDVKPDGGSLCFAGTPLDTHPPSGRCRLGIGRTYQIPHPFTGMTVFENVLVGAAFGADISESAANRVAIDILDRCGLIDKANQLAGSLTLLDRKRLELARALASGPRLLLLDEIAGGLTEHEVHDLIALIKEIRESGVSLIWIEHIVHALMAVVDRLMVINFGALLREGAPRAVMDSPDVKEIYMGIDVE